MPHIETDAELVEDALRFLARHHELVLARLSKNAKTGRQVILDIRDRLNALADSVEGDVWSNGKKVVVVGDRKEEEK